MKKWGILLLIVVVILGIGYYLYQRDTPEGPSEPAPAPATAAETATEDATCPQSTQVGSGNDRAGLVMTFGDGTTQTFCVSFDGTITTYQLLLDADPPVQIITQDFGGSLGQALCKVTSGSESDGCDYPNEDCFCDSPPNSWVFFVTDSSGTSWVQSQTGISSTNVNDGDTQGFRWGDGSTTPPDCFFADICDDQGEDDDDQGEDG